MVLSWTELTCIELEFGKVLGGSGPGDAIATGGGGVGEGRGTAATTGVGALTVDGPGTRSTTEGALVGGEVDGPAATAGILILIFAFEGF